MGIIKRNTKGYTFVELMVAMGIFASVLVLVTGITINFNNSQKRERARNMLIEETQFLVSRMTEMIRENQIDYAEYYSNGLGRETPVVYGDDPKEYEWHFYYLPTCESIEEHGENLGADGVTCDRFDEDSFDEGYFDTYADKYDGSTDPGGNFDNPSANALLEPDDAVGTGGYMQRELYLISEDGTQKTILRRMDNGIDDDGDGSVDENYATFWKADESDGNLDGGERLGILQLVAENDLDSDGELDFETAADFQTDGDSEIELNDFVPITPKTIDIVDLKFYISPLDDPRKAFSETSIDVQVQPHVTILMTTRPGVSWRRSMAGGENISLSLQTTISSRIISNVLFPDP